MILNFKQLLKMPLFHIYIILSGLVGAFSVEITGMGTDPNQAPASLMGMILLFYVCVLATIPVSYIVVNKIRNTLIEKTVTVWQLFVMSFAYILKIFVPLLLLFLVLAVPLTLILGADTVKNNSFLLLPLALIIVFIVFTAWFYTVVNGSSRGVLFKGGWFKVAKNHFLPVLAFTLVAAIAGLVPELLKAVIPYSPLSPMLLIYFVSQLILTALIFTLFFWVLEDVVEGKAVE